MRTPSLLLPLALLACDAGPGPSAGDDTSATDTDAPPQVAQCSEAYVVPGLAGAASATAPDPHAEVYGSEQAVGGHATATVGPVPKHVHLGWPGQDTSRSVSFVWSTDPGTLASVVELAEGTDLSGEVVRHEGASFALDGDVRVHELKLCGRLKPNTAYSYRVGGEGGWSPVYTFSTPGEPGSFDTFTVAVAGDSRSVAFETWRNIVEKLRAESPDLVLFTGDMVELGINQHEWYGWWEASGDLFAETFLVPTHGNHEFLAANYFALFSLPNNEQWFSLDYGNLTLVSLNDTVADLVDLKERQPAFLRDVLGASGADWRVAMHHQALWSTSKHGSNVLARDAWQPALEEGGVQLVLAGHNHTYERSVPLRDGAPASEGEGTVHVVTGGAGAPLYSAGGAEWFKELGQSVEHYVVARFGPDEVELTAKDLVGNTIDRFTIPRR